MNFNIEAIHSLFFFFLQGRYGKGSGQEYLKFFMVEYKRPGIHAEWRLYTDKNSHQVSLSTYYIFVPSGSHGR